MRRSNTSGTLPRGPFRADQLHSGDPYELSDGHALLCLPTGGSGTGPNGLGFMVTGSDPMVTEAGVDAGYSPEPGVLRAPDVAVGNVPNKPGWIKGAPELAIEYADVGQDEPALQQKIHDVLDAGTKFLWVVRLVGPRRVEVYAPDKPMVTVLPGHHLIAEGVLQNPVLVESLYDRDAAQRAALTNLLQREGYKNLEAVLAQGRAEGIAAGRIVEARSALRRVLARRKLALSAEEEATITLCMDLAVLERWHDEAVVAERAADVLQ